VLLLDFYSLNAKKTSPKRGQLLLGYDRAPDWGNQKDGSGAMLIGGTTLSNICSHKTGAGISWTAGQSAKYRHNQRIGSLVWLLVALGVGVD
jgi:hypothetical protein